MDGLPSIAASLLALGFLAAPAATAPEHGGPPAPAVDVAPVGPAAPAVRDEYDDLYRGFTELQPDPSLVASVEAPISLIRPGLQLSLREGRVSLLRVGEETVGAVFSGSGAMHVSPPLTIEQEHLQRVMGANPFRADIRSVAILFRDSTLAELEARLDFAPGEVDGEARDAVREAIAYLKDTDSETLDSGIMRAFLNQEDNGLFHAHVRPTGGDALFYRYDASMSEEVTFGRDDRGPGDVYRAINQFHPLEHYADGSWRTEEADHLATMDAYRVDIDMAGNLVMDFDATVTLTPTRDGAVWIPMGIFDEMEVDSASWGGGTAASLHYREDSGHFWVRTPDDARAGDPLELRVWYRGELVERRQSWYGLKSSAAWYPRYGEGLATFDLTFRTPENHVVASIGDRVEEETEGGRRMTRWVSDGPAFHASFSVGPFEVSEYLDERVPPLEIHIQREGHARLLADLPGLLQQRGMDQQVGLDVANSLAFFQDRFGPIAADTFHVTEIPYSHGQAFPGMIHLSMATYLQTRQEGYDEMFRAHEVAHQWWGLGVEPQTYRDVWLAEGLSEFAALWYMHLVRQDPRRYYERLADYRDEILELDEETGPIWLGRRLGNRESPEDYSVVVYHKGAWVFHMLRMLMMDLDQNDETPFNELMRSLWEAYQGDRLSTEELRQHAEAHFGSELGWFFQQWVYGTAVPRYRFSHTGRTLESGEYQMFGRVVQQDVPDDFVMFVPVLLDFGDEGTARMRVRVQGPQTEFEFPLLPREPDQVVFNDLQGVLAEVETGGWEGPDPWAGEGREGR